MDSWSFLVIAFWESLCSWSDTMMRVMLNSQDVSRRMTLQLKAVVTLNPLCFSYHFFQESPCENSVVAERKDSAVIALEKTGVWLPSTHGRWLTTTCFREIWYLWPLWSPTLTCTYLPAHWQTYICIIWILKKRVYISSFSGNVFFLVEFLKNLILAHLRRFGTVKEVLDVWAVSVNLAWVNRTWILAEALGSWESLARRSPQLWLCSASCLLCSCSAAFNSILMCYICALGCSIANCRFLSK